MFANISSFPSRLWHESQIEAARELSDDGTIIDVRFPYVEPDATLTEIKAQAESVVNALSDNVTVAMVQGEFVLTLEICKRLIARGVRCYNAALNKEMGERGTPVRVFVTFREITL